MITREQADALVKIVDRPATDEEIDQVREYLNAHVATFIRSPDFGKWIKHNKDRIQELNAQQRWRKA